MPAQWLCNCDDRYRIYMNEETFKINEVAYDRQNKEYVKITNMFCPICAQGRAHPDVFNGRHPVRGVECATTPFEAVALRLFGSDADGKPLIGFTYRGVDAKQLTKVEDQTMMDVYLLQEGATNHFVWIGRV